MFGDGVVGVSSKKGLERGRRGNLAEVEDSRMVEVAVGNSHQEGAGHIVVVEDQCMDSFMKCGVGVIIVFCGVVNLLLVLIEDI